MPASRSRHDASPRLQARHALPMALLAMAVVLLGTPGRNDPHRAMAQTPPQPSRPSAPTATVPYPVPPELQGIDLSRQTVEMAAAKSAGCLSCHRGQHEPALQARDRPPRLRRLPRRRSHVRRRPAQAHVWPRFPDAWGSVGQSGPVLHAPESRVARFHPLREPRRPPGRAPELRHGELPRRAGPPGAQEHDDPRRHALGRGAVQQRLGAVQGGPLRRELQHARRPAAAADGPAADGVRDGHGRASCRSSTRCRDSRCRSPATSCGSSSAAGTTRRRSASPTRSRSRARPAAGLSSRGLGTRNRTDPVFIGLQKTRLFDPTLNFLGTNDHPGDYRSSGCTACHVIYANDRSPVNSGPYAAFGHQGLSFQADPDDPARTSRAIRSSTGSRRPSRPASASSATSTPAPTCSTRYTGYMWWDEETDGELMYPAAAEVPDGRGIHPAR